MNIQTDFHPITNNIHKTERKFLCIKPHLLYDYLNKNATFLHSYIIEQKYYNGSKYRKYESNKRITYVKHTLGSKLGSRKYVNIEAITEDEYNSVVVSNTIRKSRSAYEIFGSELILNIDILSKNRILVEVWCYTDKDSSLEQYRPPKGLVEVTDIQYFSYKYTAQNDDNILSRKLIVVEGTDLIGKTTVVRQLVSAGYICLDRDQYDFSNHVTLTDTPAICAERIRNAYTGRNNYVVVVMYTDNDELLNTRVKERINNNEISEYDLECKEYNTIYKDILQYLQASRWINIIGINVDGKSSSKIVEEIISGVDKYAEG